LLLPYLLFCNLSHISRYKRCPSDKILVIYGRTGGTSAKCIHGGGAFIWPVVQDYQYLDLKPLLLKPI
jgi:flotillin